MAELTEIRQRGCLNAQTGQSEKKTQTKKKKVAVVRVHPMGGGQARVLRGEAGMKKSTPESRCQEVKKPPFRGEISNKNQTGG